MRIAMIAAVVAATILTTEVSAQAVSKDSINNLKQEKSSLEIQQKINEKKMKLAALENKVAAYETDKNNAAARAQQSADENNQAATALSNDAQNKKLAKTARKKAKQAENDVKKAQQSSDKLDGLRKDIEELRNDIAEQEKKLSNVQTSN